MLSKCPSTLTPYTLDDGSAVFELTPNLAERPEIWRPIPGFPYHLSSHGRLRANPRTMVVSREGALHRRYKNTRYIQPFLPKGSRRPCARLSLGGRQYIVRMDVLMAVVEFTYAPTLIMKMVKPTPPDPHMQITSPVARKRLGLPAQVWLQKPRVLNPIEVAQVDRQHELALARREAIKQKALAKLSPH